MRTLLAVCGVALLTATAVACGSDDSEGGSGGEKATIGFSTITLSDQFFVRLNGGAKQAAKAAGADLILQNPNGDPVAQATQVENFIQQGVDAIIVDPIDPNGIVPALNQAKDQSVPVVAVDEVLEGVEAVASSAGNDNRAVGRKLGERLVEQVEKSGKPARVGVVMTVDSPIENARLEGFKEAIAGSSDITIVNRVDAKYALDKAANGAENLITSDPTLNWFYATGGIYGTGIVSAIKSQNKTGKIKLIGWDLSKQLIEAMREGTYVLAAEQNATAIGEAAVDAAVKVAAGAQVPRLNVVPVDFVTKATVDEFVDRYPD